MLSSENDKKIEVKIDPLRVKYPFCVVWTPVPLLTWLIPFVGHVGIGKSNGIIRDFAGSYYVSENEMAFGKPTKYWKLNINKVNGGISVYDESIQKASDVYVGRMHNLLFDNCHSHVALALNTMKYEGNENWNMFRIAFMLTFKSKYVNWFSIFKSWLPFISLLLTLILFTIFLN